MGIYGLGASLAALALTHANRVFDAAGISRTIEAMRNTDHHGAGRSSLAGGRHEHKRAVARRLRQLERDAANQRARAQRWPVYVDMPGVERVSRRYRPVAA